MKKVYVTGASGFIGRHLVKQLSSNDNIEIHAFCKKKELTFCKKKELSWFEKNRICIHQLDLANHKNFENIIEPECVVVNLAFSRNYPQALNVTITKRLLEICRKKGVSKLIHCSSATVVGSANDDIVTEKTQCQPKTEYEKTKFEIEQILLEADSACPEITILRPTAVFGSGGKNLIKLVNDLRCHSKFYNYIKSCLYQRRSMNLVYIETVVRAFEYFIITPNNDRSEIFIVSDDEYLENNYADIERRLMKFLGISYYHVKRIELPLKTLTLILLMKGYSNTNPLRRYSCEKLLRHGFRKKTSFNKSLKLYATECCIDENNKRT